MRNKCLHIYLDYVEWSSLCRKLSVSSLSLVFVMVWLVALVLGGLGRLQAYSVQNPALASGCFLHTSPAFPAVKSSWCGEVVWITPASLHLRKATATTASFKLRLSVLLFLFLWGRTFLAPLFTHKVPRLPVLFSEVSHATVLLSMARLSWIRWGTLDSAGRLSQLSPAFDTCLPWFEHVFNPTVRYLWTTGSGQIWKPRMFLDVYWRVQANFWIWINIFKF